jgi:hypothetical protein
MSLIFFPRCGMSYGEKTKVLVFREGSIDANKKEKH